MVNEDFHYRRQTSNCFNATLQAGAPLVARSNQSLTDEQVYTCS